MKSAAKADGTEYYNYVLCYVDDVLVGSEHHPNKIMDSLRSVYALKADSVKEPLAGTLKSLTLRAVICQARLDGWAMPSTRYTTRAVKDDVETELAKADNKVLATKADTPLAAG